MDLANLNTKELGEKGAELHLLHPATEEPLFHNEKPVTIRLAGSDSNLFRKANAAIVRRVQGKKGKQTSEEFEAAVTEQLAAVTLGFSNLVFNGEPAVFSKEKAIEIYEEYRWIREQVAEFVANRANFLPNA